MCKCNSTAPAEVLTHTSNAQCFQEMLGAGLEFKLVLNCCFKVCKFQREMRFQQLHVSDSIWLNVQLYIYHSSESPDFLIYFTANWST